MHSTPDRHAAPVKSWPMSRGLVPLVSIALGWSLLLGCARAPVGAPGARVTDAPAASGMTSRKRSSELVWFRFDYPHVTVFATDPLVAEQVARETLPIARSRSVPPARSPYLIVLPLDAPLPVTPRQVVERIAEDTDDPSDLQELLEADRELRRQLRGVPEDVLDRIPFAVSLIPFPAVYVASQILDFDVSESPALIPYATDAQIRILFDRGCEALAQQRPVAAWLARQFPSWRNWAAWRDGMLRFWWGDDDGPAGR